MFIKKRIGIEMKAEGVQGSFGDVEKSDGLIAEKVPFLRIEGNADSIGGDVFNVLGSEIGRP
jgi:hypothetical protein